MTSYYKTIMISIAKPTPVFFACFILFILCGWECKIVQTEYPHKRNGILYQATCFVACEFRITIPFFENKYAHLKGFSYDKKKKKKI